MIGIVTLHHGLNYGAILQSLCMAKLFDAKIVDQRYVEKILVYDPLGPDGHLQLFIDHSLPLTPRFISCGHDEVEALEWMQQNLSGIVFGSDELWRLKYKSFGYKAFLKSMAKDPRGTLLGYRHLQKNPWAPPFPNIYWPRLDIPSISMSASMGDQGWGAVPRRHLKLIAKSLRNLEFIGVRDRFTKQRVEAILEDPKREVHLTPDPVFSHTTSDAIKESARRKLETNGVDVSRPFVYLAIDPNREEQAREKLQGIDHPVVDLRMIQLDPLEWFAAIGLAAGGITDRMHALISSLVQNTPCLTIDSRLKSLELVQDFKLGPQNSLVEIIAEWPALYVREEVARRRIQLNTIAHHLKTTVFAPSTAQVSGIC